MFDRFYDVINIGSTKSNPFSDDPALLKTLHFSFETEAKNEYLVNVACYTSSLYIIEFFERRHKNNKSDSKYGLLTNEGKASKIIRTCFEIFLKILARDAWASLAFIGFPTFRGIQQKLNFETTRRFTIYRYVAINLLGGHTFMQFEDNKTSCYLIANKRTDLPELKDLASRILKSSF